jgi:hypothetical protein
MVGRKFDLWLEEHGEPSNFRRALTDVTEAAYLVKLWFDDHGVSYTAADLVYLSSAGTITPVFPVKSSLNPSCLSV